jgi:hypothetical protein
MEINWKKGSKFISNFDLVINFHIYNNNFFGENANYHHINDKKYYQKAIIPQDCSIKYLNNNINELYSYYTDFFNKSKIYDYKYSDIDFRFDCYIKFNNKIKIPVDIIYFETFKNLNNILNLFLRNNYNYEFKNEYGIGDDLFIKFTKNKIYFHKISSTKYGKYIVENINFNRKIFVNEIIEKLKILNTIVNKLIEYYGIDYWINFNNN